VRVVEIVNRSRSIGGEGRIRTYGPAKQDSSHKEGCYDYSRSRTSPLHYQASLEKSCLKSIDHMDCSAWVRESAVEFVLLRSTEPSIAKKRYLHIGRANGPTEREEQEGVSLSLISLAI
jgi:hypothetical protein